MSDDRKQRCVERKLSQTTRLRVAVALCLLIKILRIVIKIASALVKTELFIYLFLFYFIMKIALEVQKRIRTYNENTHYKLNKKYYPKLISANTVNNGVDIVKNFTSTITAH